MAETPGILTAKATASFFVDGRRFTDVRVDGLADMYLGRDGERDTLLLVRQCMTDAVRKIDDALERTSELKAMEEALQRQRTAKAITRRCVVRLPE
jgi:hypothetical protein